MASVLNGEMWIAVMEIADRRAAGRQLGKGQLASAMHMVANASIDEITHIMRE